MQLRAAATWLVKGIKRRYEDMMRTTMMCHSHGQSESEYVQLNTCKQNRDTISRKEQNAKKIAVIVEEANQLADAVIV